MFSIEEITAGMLVYAHNPDTGETELKEVVQTFVNETNELVHIKVSGEEIITTPTHPFWVPEKGWTDAIQLRAGDRLQLLNGEYVIVEQVQHEILEAPVTVYNFEVEDFHTYYVSDSSILVHNKCGNNGKIPNNKSQTNHIFRNAPGHIPDTPNNRSLLENTTTSKNYLGIDTYGNEWYANILNDGRQVWVEVRNGIIWDGGINDIPRTWNNIRGLKG